MKDENDKLHIIFRYISLLRRKKKYYVFNTSKISVEFFISPNFESIGFLSEFSPMNVLR